jgi:hypothetical protein
MDIPVISVERHDMATISYPPGAGWAAGAVYLDDTFRDLLAAALVTRQRAQIRSQPELMFLRSSWDAGEWARAEADTLLAHIRTELEHRAPRR